MSVTNLSKDISKTTWELMLQILRWSLSTAASVEQDSTNDLSWLFTWEFTPERGLTLVRYAQGKKKWWKLTTFWHFFIYFLFCKHILLSGINVIHLGCLSWFILDVHLDSTWLSSWTISRSSWTASWSASLLAFFQNIFQHLVHLLILHILCIFLCAFYVLFMCFLCTFYVLVIHIVCMCVHILCTIYGCVMHILCTLWCTFQSQRIEMQDLLNKILKW